MSQQQQVSTGEKIVIVIGKILSALVVLMVYCFYKAMKVNNVGRRRR